MSDLPWVVMDAKDKSLKCLRCGAKEEAHIPSRLEVFIFQMRTFTRNHRRCKP